MVIRTLALTGASSGIGAALAAEYAAPGITMLLIARDGARLADVAAAAEAKGAAVTQALIDVTDAAAMHAALSEFESKTAGIDLVIANAGVALGGFPPPAGQARRLTDVNWFGMLNTVEPLLPVFMARRGGQIAVISSISAIRPSGDLPLYSATKAAVRAYGQAIRAKLRGHGVAVTVICPGFIATPMADRHKGPKPFEMPAAKAARLIKRGIARRRGHMTFPLAFSVMVFFGNRLPPFLSDWFERRFAADVPGAGE